MFAELPEGRVTAATHVETTYLGSFRTRGSLPGGSPAPPGKPARSRLRDALLPAGSRTMYSQPSREKTLAF